jgi:[acyl-carrier-protein] S-malonyltransferase
MNKICYIFPGQGSQYVGMGKDLYDNFPEAQVIFDQSEKILGFDIKKLCFEGPAEELNQTVNCQVAVVVTSIAALEAFKGLKTEKNEYIEPSFCAGLSLGETSALVASNAIEFKDAVSLVRRRGEIMNKVSGSMASIIGLSIDVLKDVCRDTGAEIANLNCPGQITLAGTKESIEKAMALSQEKGARKTVLLNVSGPFHSSIMKEVEGLMRQEIDKTRFFSPSIPVISNVTVDFEKTPEEIRRNMLSQLCSPARWEECIRRIASQGCSTFFEIGPGKVLKGLLRRINPELKVYNVGTMEDICASYL